MVEAFVRRSESLRAYAPGVVYYHASATGLDIADKSLVCRTTVDDGDGEEFRLSYDKLVVAVGCLGQTFGIPGVEQHAIPLRDVPDARRIRSRIYSCFEKAAEPTVTSDDERRRLLSVAIVGGGPTGIELAGELHDLVAEDLHKLYPDLVKHTSLTVFDVAPRILPGFDKNLAHYAVRKFQRQNMHIRTETRIREVKEDRLVLESGEEFPFGMCVWSTGLKPNPLVDKLGLEKDRRGVLVTDDFCRARAAQDGPDPAGSIYAIGDCATVEGFPLPQTAQVASQKAVWLSKHLNSLGRGDAGKPFSYGHRGSMVYLGSWSSIVDLSRNVPENSWFKGIRGYLAWITWRSAYLTMSVSLRNKLLIPWYWFVSFVAGRDTSKYK
ncbi:FAD/NAD-P-binding domain-containing protein [Hyaloraphidium curvatum]|nr:FAD/NAD-P-binding domain-containing protein [Hyaloraphidium curvatum]